MWYCDVIVTLRETIPWRLGFHGWSLVVYMPGENGGLEVWLPELAKGLSLKCYLCIVYNRFETSAVWFETMEKQLLLNNSSVVERKRNCVFLSLLCGSFECTLATPVFASWRGKEKNTRCVCEIASYVAKSMYLWFIVCLTVLIS